MRFQRVLSGALRRLVVALAWLCGAGVMAMTLVTGADIVARWLGRPVAGAYDIVRMAAAVTVACAMPYTAAIWGHVSVEYFFHRLGPGGRRTVNIAQRVLGMLLFAVMAWQSARYGLALRAAGEVSPTLQWPIFWIPGVIAAGCALTAAVLAHTLVVPDRDLVRP